MWLVHGYRKRWLVETGCKDFIQASIKGDSPGRTIESAPVQADNKAWGNPQQTRKHGHANHNTKGTQKTKPYFQKTGNRPDGWVCDRRWGDRRERLLDQLCDRLELLI